MVRQEASWDLLAIIVFAGAFSTVYQWRHKVLLIDDNYRSLALTHQFCYRRISVASPRCYQRSEAQNVHPHQQACEAGTPRSIT